MNHELPVSSRVMTPDGEGHIVGYDPTQARPYYVFLNIEGTTCNVDCLRQYHADDLVPTDAASQQQTGQADGCR